MSKGGRIVPVGMRKLSKGGHSERNSTGKAPWFQCGHPDPSKAGAKSQKPYVPPCISQSQRQVFDYGSLTWKVENINE